jgi:hypothetical protein
LRLRTTLAIRYTAEIGEILIQALFSIDAEEQTDVNSVLQVPLRCLDRVEYGLDVAALCDAVCFDNLGGGSDFKIAAEMLVTEVRREEMRT